MSFATVVLISSKKKVFFLTKGVGFVNSSALLLRKKKGYKPLFLGPHIKQEDPLNLSI